MYSPLLRDDTFTADATCVGLTAAVNVSSLCSLLLRECLEVHVWRMQ
jgi:hypothetical protein